MLKKHVEIYHVGVKSTKAHCGTVSENIIRDKAKASPWTYNELINLQKSFNKFAVICKKCLNKIKERKSNANN